MHKIRPELIELSIPILYKKKNSVRHAAIHLQRKQQIVQSESSSLR